MEAENLLHHRVQVWQVGDVRLRHQTVGANDSVQLRLQPAQEVRVAQQLRQAPLDGDAGGVGSCGQRVLPWMPGRVSNSVDAQFGSTPPRPVAMAGEFGQKWRQFG